MSRDLGLKSWQMVKARAEAIDSTPFPFDCCFHFLALSFLGTIAKQALPFSLQTFVVDRDVKHPFRLSCAFETFNVLNLSS